MDYITAIEQKTILVQSITIIGLSLKALQELSAEIEIMPFGMVVTNYTNQIERLRKTRNTVLENIRDIRNPAVHTLYKATQEAYALTWKVQIAIAKYIVEKDVNGICDNIPYTTWYDDKIKHVDNIILKHKKVS